MKFVVTRYSQLPADYHSEKPCDEAVTENLKMIQSMPVAELKNWRFTNSVGKFDPIGDSIWFNIGTNHRVEDGIAKRDFENVPFWTVDLDAPGIKAFIEKYQVVLIFDEAFTPHGYKEIRIIDGNVDTLF